jgi:hypothetical protein
MNDKEAEQYIKDYRRALKVQTDALKARWKIEGMISVLDTLIDGEEDALSQILEPIRAHLAEGLELVKGPSEEHLIQLNLGGL